MCVRACVCAFPYSDIEHTCITICIHTYYFLCGICVDKANYQGLFNIIKPRPQDSHQYKIEY